MRHASRRPCSAIIHRLALVVLSLPPSFYRLLRFVLPLSGVDWVRVTQEKRNTETEGAMTDLDGPG
jgi:hypothetical protein